MMALHNNHTPAAAGPPSEAPPRIIAAALAEGEAEEREAAYATMLSAVRGSGGKEQAVALAAACAKPLIVSVLCAPASRIAATEWRRASLLLYELCTAQPLFPKDLIQDNIYDPVVRMQLLK